MRSWGHLDVGLLASRAARHMSLVKPPVCGALLGRPGPWAQAVAPTTSGRGEGHVGSRLPPRPGHGPGPLGPPPPPTPRVFPKSLSRRAGKQVHLGGWGSLFQCAGKGLALPSWGVTVAAAT